MIATSSEFIATSFWSSTAVGPWRHRSSSDWSQPHRSPLASPDLRQHFQDLARVTRSRRSLPCFSLSSPELPIPPLTSFHLPRCLQPRFRSPPSPTAIKTLELDWGKEAQVGLKIFKPNQLNPRELGSGKLIQKPDPLSGLIQAGSLDPTRSKGTRPDRSPT